VNVVARLDITVGGEPVGAVEFLRDASPRRGRSRVRLGDSTGASYEYTYAHGVSESYGPIGLANATQSALTKDWWRPECPKCRSAERGVRLRYLRWYPHDEEIDCDYYWHEGGRA
jgi:hypothetical protein